MSILTEQWPVSFAEQKIFAKEALEKVRELCARNETVFLRQFYQPTQSQWENAWVEQTGNPLPIPVGTRLLWLSLITGSVLSYTTTKDGVGGNFSTNTIRELIDTNYDRPSIRFLAYTRANIIPVEANISATFAFAPNDLGKNFINPFVNPYRIYHWAEKGLINIIIFYKLRTANVAVTRMTVGFGQADLQWFVSPPGGGLAQLIETAYGEVTNAANNANHASLQQKAAWSARIPNSASLADGYSQGVAFINNIARRTRANGEQYDSQFGVGGVHVGSYIHTSFASANLFIQRGAMVKVDEYEPGKNFGSVGGEIPGLATDISGEAWMYGLFNKSATQELSDYGTL